MCSSVEERRSERSLLESGLKPRWKKEKNKKEKENKKMLFMPRLQ
jgi:hypothetical protein